MVKFKWLGPTLIGIAFTISLALSSWALSKIADMPKEYVLKEDFNEFRHENRLDHKEIMRILREIERKE